MAQAHSHSHPPTQPPPSRPSITTFPPSSYQRDYASNPPSRSGSFSAASPVTGMGLSLQSPQPFSAPSYGQPPATKKPRLSPDAQSPYAMNSAPPTPVGNMASPVAAMQTPITQTALNRPGLMAPPQRPADRIAEDRNYDDILSGTGINIEEEARNLTRPDFFGGLTPATPFQSRSGSFEFNANSFGQPGSSGTLNSYTSSSGRELFESTEEDKEVREKHRADWEAARHAQHALWDMFLYSGILNDKVKTISQKEHLVDSQAGVLVNTQRHAPPPQVRINGLEGASQVIDQGQSILDTGPKADRLAEVLKVVSLAAKSRLSGLLSAAARLSVERQQHSKGRIPTEWADIAVPIRAKAGDEGGNATSPSSSSAQKRTHSQANSADGGNPDSAAVYNRIATAFQKAGDAERSEEDARRTKRLKRKAGAPGDATSGAVGTDITAEAALAAALDPEKKTTKKERKLAESKFSEQQQHKSANEAARMAVSGLLGNRFGNLGGKKQRTYDWMNPGKSGASTPTLTPGGRPSLSTVNSATITPTSERPRPIPKDKQVGVWDEDKDPGIQARDVLLVLESDGKAPRSYVKGYSLVEG